MPVKTINSFGEFMQVIGNDKPVVMDLTATWCGPCRAIAPVFEKMSDAPEFAAVEFCKVDIDAQDQVAHEVNIRAVPTIIYFRNGNKEKEMVGADAQRLEDLVRGASSDARF